MIFKIYVLRNIDIAQFASRMISVTMHHALINTASCLFHQIMQVSQHHVKTSHLDSSMHHKCIIITSCGDFLMMHDAI